MFINFPDIPVTPSKGAPVGLVTIRLSRTTTCRCRLGPNQTPDALAELGSLLGRVLGKGVTAPRLDELQLGLRRDVGTRRADG